MIHDDDDAMLYVVFVTEAVIYRTNEKWCNAIALKYEYTVCCLVYKTVRLDTLL